MNENTPYVPWFVLVSKMFKWLLANGRDSEAGYLIGEAYDCIERKQALVDAYYEECNASDREAKGLKAQRDEAYDIIANKDADIEALYVKHEAEVAALMRWQNDRRHKLERTIDELQDIIIEHLNDEENVNVIVNRMADMADACIMGDRETIAMLAKGLVSE
jgi:hypothetical protein